MAGRAREDFKTSGLRFDEILPGNYDPEAHVRDMELDGIDVSVVYPANSIFVYLEPDRELARACLRSYNDWVLDDFQRVRSDRLVALPMLPVDDGPDVAVQELDRVLAKGARGAFIPGMPRRPYHDPYYEGLWQAVEDRDVPLTFHRTFGGPPPDQDFDELVEQNVSMAGTVTRFFSAVRPLTYLLFNGVFDRHPHLRIVAGEVNFGWLPFWAQTMEQQYDVGARMHDVALTRRPTEYLGHNIFVTGLDDAVGFEMIKDGIGWLADCCMFSTDYPHSVTLWPHTADYIAALTEGMREVDRDKVLAGNAARVYRL
jgi:predicted TIM-barrel fold metal-dependent hydrolase